MDFPLKFQMPFIITSKSRRPVSDPTERRTILHDHVQSLGYDDPQRRRMDTKARIFSEFLSDFKLTKLTDYDSYMNAGLRKVWATFRSFDLIAKAVLSTEFRIEKAKKPLDENSDHPLLTLMQEPNPFDSWEEIIYPWVFHMGLTGNAYWLKDEIDGKGRPSSIYGLLPQFIEVIPDRIKKIARYDYRVNGRILQFTPEELIHFKRPHPNSIIFGIGDVEAAEPLFEDFINRAALEASYIDKGGAPSGILSKKDAVEDPDEWKKFKAKWDEDYGGRENSGKTAFLSGDWTYTKLGLTPEELEGVERTRMTVEQIFCLHGVPLSVAGLEAADNYATAKQHEIQFKRWTVIPYLDLLCTKLNSGTQLSRNYERDIRVCYEVGGLTDIAAIVTEYMPLVINGTMTRNELREMCKLEKAKGEPMMDEFLINSGLVPISMAGMGGMGLDPGAGDAFGNGEDVEGEEEETENHESDDKEDNGRPKPDDKPSAGRTPPKKPGKK